MVKQKKAQRAVPFTMRDSWKVLQKSWSYPSQMQTQPRLLERPPFPGRRVYRQIKLQIRKALGVILRIISLMGPFRWRPPLHMMPGDAEWVPAFCRKPVTLCHQEFTSCAGSVPVRVLAKLVWIWSDFPNLKDLNFSRWWPSVAKTTLSSLQSSLPQLLFNLNHSQLRKIDFLGHFYTFHGAVATNSFWNVPSQQAN